MDKLATASINSFGNSPKADVSLSESNFVLTASQLRQIITEAVQETIQPLQDRIESLEFTVAIQGAEIAATSLKLASLESLQEQDTTRICLDIAYDRRRLAMLEKVEPQPLQKDRGEILRALIAANGGKMLAKDARQKMRISKQAFTNLLATVDGIKLMPYKADKRQRLLILE